MGSSYYGGSEGSSDSLMSVNGLHVRFHMPPALESMFRGEEEVAQGLPPYASRKAYLVDELLGAPEDWLRSEPGKSSYVVPVKPEHGIWLDFNMNARHEHDVAVLISIQGVNALTTQKTDLPRLEQYRDVCPVHGTPFTADHRCNDCGFDWPAQNYISTTGAPGGYLWLDGFKAKDGVTRQWVLTESEVRSVARAVLGEERAFALGVVFFLSKEPKPVRVRENVALAPMGGGLTLSADSGDVDDFDDDGIALCACIDEVTLDAMGDDGDEAYPEPVERTPRKKLEVAAGARIDQPVHPDPKPLEYWQEEPAGMVVITYCPEQVMEEVLAKGKKVNEGPLTNLGVPLGHPVH